MIKENNTGRIRSIFSKNLFKDQVILVTGGGSGIGLRTARELAGLGAKLVIAGRNESKLEAASELITKEGGICRSLAMDIRDEKEVQQCFESIKKEEGSLEAVVNNAGGQFPSPAAEMSFKGWKAVIENNLNGTFLVSQTAYNEFFKKNGGKIVNVLANFWKGFPNMAHTGAARAGVDNLTKTLAIEWGRNGVSVNAVAPGVIESSGLSNYDEKFKKFVYDQAKNNQTNRLGTEAEVACVILFLLSPVAKYLTGETIKIDGGESLYNPFMPPAEHDKMKPEL